MLIPSKHVIQLQGASAVSLAGGNELGDSSQPYSPNSFSGVLAQHTEAQDGNLILGGPQEDPDLADVLRGPAADDAQEADGTEAPDESAAAHDAMQLASIPEGSEQAAQTGRAPRRRGRASARASAPEQPANLAPPEQAATGKPRGSGRRKRGAPMASIAEEAAAPEQPSNAQSVEDGAAKGAWGGRSRRKASAMPQSVADSPGS